MPAPGPDEADEVDEAKASPAPAATLSDDALRALVNPDAKPDALSDDALRRLVSGSSQQQGAASQQGASSQQQIQAVQEVKLQDDNSPAAVQRNLLEERSQQQAVSLQGESAAPSSQEPTATLKSELMETDAQISEAEEKLKEAEVKVAIAEAEVKAEAMARDVPEPGAEAEVARVEAEVKAVALDRDMQVAKAEAEIAEDKAEAMERALPVPEPSPASTAVQFGLGLGLPSRNNTDGDAGFQAPPPRYQEAPGSSKLNGTQEEAAAKMLLAPMEPAAAPKDDSALKLPFDHAIIGYWGSGPYTPFEGMEGPSIADALTMGYNTILLSYADSFTVNGSFQIHTDMCPWYNPGPAGTVHECAPSKANISKEAGVDPDSWRYLLSFGGKDGAGPYMSALLELQERYAQEQAFAVGFLKQYKEVKAKYGFDGIDIDVESTLTTPLLSAFRTVLKTLHSEGEIVALAPETPNLVSHRTHPFTLGRAIANLSPRDDCTIHQSVCGRIRRS